MADWYQDVLDFHKKFGCYVQDRPAIPSKGTATLRRNIITEEVKETLDALERGDMIELADGIADVIYVLLGTAVSYGIDIRPVWDEVQKSNMAKEGGKTRDDGKILKPPGWTPPDIGRILREQGFAN